MTTITAEELAGALERVHLLDIRYYMTEPGRGFEEYSAGHIPGAVFVDLDADLARPTGPGGIGGRHPLPDPEVFQTTLRRLGVSNGVEVVVYDQGNSLSAGRAWWMLKDSGIQVRVLDGGWAVWQKAGLPVSNERPLTAPGDVVVRPGHLGIADASDVANRGTVRLLDVRTAERFTGRSEPIDRVPGRIPGAENVPSHTLFEDDGRFGTPERIREAFGELNSADILSCGSGITAAQAAMVAEHAGLPVPRVYMGSYSDWISDPSRQIATG